MFGLEEFWVIWSKTHNWVIKTHGTHTFFLFGLIFTLCFHHSKLTNFELEWWKHKTRIRCFQKLRYITQCHHSRFLSSVEPTASILSCQLKAITVANLKRRPFLFLTSLKIFQPKISPLSHLPLSIFLFSSLRISWWWWLVWRWWLVEE